MGRERRHRGIVITGAGSGLGRALAVALARPRCEPVTLVLVGRRRERLLRTRAACVEAGLPAGDALVITADVGARDGAERIVGGALGRLGRLDVLVNNAGLARFAALDAANTDDWDRMMQTNVLGPARLIRRALPALRESRGLVVNVGSIGGCLALPGRAVYGASKAALAHLTRSLARELAPDVRVNAVLPGAIDTEMYDDLGLDPAASAALRSEMARATPLGRLGDVSEVVPWIEMLLGPAGTWMTGSLVTVDGGRSA